MEVKTKWKKQTKVVASGNFLNRHKYERIFRPDRRFKGNERKELVDKLTSVASDAFGMVRKRDDVEQHALNVDMLYLIQCKDVITGFATYDFLYSGGEKVLYLNGIVVQQCCQQKGIFSKVNKLAMKQDDFDYLAMRTQNPVVYAAASKIVSKLYPGTTGMPERVKNVGRYLAQHLGSKNFNLGSFVDKGTFGMCFYGEVPGHKTATSFFTDELKMDLEAGDTVLLVGEK
ncbi:MAG: hypothetical protein ABIF40_02195 [archaeon]